MKMKYGHRFWKKYLNKVWTCFAGHKPCSAKILIWSKSFKLISRKSYFRLFFYPKLWVIKKVRKKVLRKKILILVIWQIRFTQPNLTYYYTTLNSGVLSHHRFTETFNLQKTQVVLLCNNFLSGRHFETEYQMKYLLGNIWHIAKIKQDLNGYLW